MHVYWVYPPMFLHHLRAILFTFVNLIETEPLQLRYTWCLGFFLSSFGASLECEIRMCVLFCPLQSTKRNINAF